MTKNWEKPMNPSLLSNRVSELTAKVLTLETRLTYLNERLELLERMTRVMGQALEDTIRLQIKGSGRVPEWYDEFYQWVTTESASASTQKRK